MKQGSATGNTLGTLAVMYSAFGVLFSWARGDDDDINTVLAGTATGLLYKSTGRSCSLLDFFFRWNHLGIKIFFAEHFSRESPRFFQIQCF